MEPNERDGPRPSHHASTGTDPAQPQTIVVIVKQEGPTPTAAPKKVVAKKAVAKKKPAKVAKKKIAIKKK